MKEGKGFNVTEEKNCKSSQSQQVDGMPFSDMHAAAEPRPCMEWDDSMIPHAECERSQRHKHGLDFHQLRPPMMSKVSWVRRESMASTDEQSAGRRCRSGLIMLPRHLLLEIYALVPECVVPHTRVCRLFHQILPLTRKLNISVWNGLGNLVQADHLRKFLGSNQEVSVVLHDPRGLDALMLAVQNFPRGKLNLVSLDLRRILCRAPSSETDSEFFRVVSFDMIVELLNLTTSLHTLSLAYNHLSDDEALSLLSAVEAPSLTSLNISSNLIRDPVECLAPILETGKLQSLDLGRNLISSQGVAGLMDWLVTNTNLSSLMLNSNDFGWDATSSEELCRVPKAKLQKLGWSFKRNICDEVVGFLEECTQLVTLDISFDDVTGQSQTALLSGLSHCTGLQSLALRSNYKGLDTYGGEQLASLLEHTITKLDTLCLISISLSNGPSITEAIMRGVQANTRLTSLSLCSSALGQEGCRLVTSYLKANSSLTFLDLRANGWTVPLGAAVWRAQRHNPKIECISGIPVGIMRRRQCDSRLRLSGMQLGPAEIGLLEQQLLDSRLAITSIDLRNNMVVGVVDTNHYACVRQALNMYDLAGLQALGRIVASQPYLQSVNLSGNKLAGHVDRASVISLNQFSQILAAAPSLRKLSLASNELTGASVLALLPILRSSPTLAKLDLSGNKISKTCNVMGARVNGFDVLAEALAGHKTLKWLNVRDQEPLKARINMPQLQPEASLAKLSQRTECRIVF